jgi:predicted ribosome quality control (RQC) complex YloA/Tae2 family protein
MGKQKLNVSDIIALINDFNKNLLNARLSNVYDINSRSFLLKFTKENKEKEFVLIDSNPQAPRFHITNQNFVRRMLPSSFCNKLRKHLTNKRITSIRQLGMDRVVDFQFGNDNVYHIIIELYDSGNLVLTDQDYNIIVLVRRYNLNKDQDNELNIKVGEKYPIDNAYQTINFDEELNNKISYLLKNNTGKNSLRNILISGSSPIVNFGKDMIIHSINKIGWSHNKKYNPEKLLEFKIDDFLDELKYIYNKIDLAKGYIIYQDEKKVDFTPILYHQFNESKFEEYENLSQAIDNYYQVNSIELNNSTKEEEKNEKKNKDIDKIDRVQKSIQDKIDKLAGDKDNSLEIAEYLMNNMNLFEFLNTFDPNDYTNSNIIKVDQKKKLLTFQSDDFETTFELDYTQNIWNNIEKYHSNKKELKTKIIKTEVSGQNAIDRLKADAKKVKKKEETVNIELPPIKEFWFQKFRWFITSSGYLVILGKDMHQNETIVKKHLDKNDIYLHSDIHGSGSCVIKDIISDTNKEPNINAVIEAGSFIICNTKSWKSNSPDKAFWVYPDQVSKTPETGEYLSTGSFIIRGKKNYINTTLQLGYGIMFKSEGDMDLKNITLTNNNINNIEWAIPMIGPYSCFKEFKYKVKLLPGNGKRGKTYKKIVNLFLKKKEINKLEKYLIKKLDTGLATDIMINGIICVS